MAARLETLVDDNLPEVIEGAVSFETTTLGNREDFVYAAPGLQPFYEDLIFGRPLPLKFATHDVDDVHTLLAMALFLHRDIAIAPATNPFVASVDLACRWGFSALAHIPREHERLIRFLRDHALVEGLTKAQRGERVYDAVTWIKEYLIEDRLPSMPPEPPPPQVIHRGDRGFVIAVTKGGLLPGWVELFRQGFLRGAIFMEAKGLPGELEVIAARKGPDVDFDLYRACTLLTEAEQVVGGTGKWYLINGMLFSPEAGTFLAMSDVLNVLIRV